MCKNQYTSARFGFLEKIELIIFSSICPRLLALVTEAQRRKLDQTPEIQALLKVRSYVILSGALQKSLIDEVKKDVAGTRVLWESEKSNYFDVVARQILIRYQGSTVDGESSQGNSRTEAQAKSLADAAYQKLKAGADFAALAATGQPWWLLGAVVCGYAFAWFGHFLFEHNKPATFRFPFSRRLTLRHQSVRRLCATITTCSMIRGRRTNR